MYFLLAQFFLAKTTEGNQPNHHTKRLETSAITYTYAVVRDIDEREREEGTSLHRPRRLRLAQLSSWSKEREEKCWKWWRRPPPQGRDKKCDVASAWATPAVWHPHVMVQHESLRDSEGRHYRSLLCSDSCQTDTNHFFRSKKIQITFQ